jgi:dynamin 1-like protein
VTRCPIILQLQPSSDTDVRSDTREYATFLHAGDKKFALKDVASEIQRQTAVVAGAQKGITNSPVVVRLFVPNALPLTLVDMVSARAL